MKYYQFQIGGRRAGKVHQHWKDAAKDAVAAGRATWTDDKHTGITLTTDDAVIARHATNPEERNG